MFISKKNMKYILITIAAAMAAAVTLVFAAKQPATADDTHKHAVCVGLDDCKDGNHGSHTEIEWEAWDASATAGTYYLSDNVDLSDTITLTGDLTLCLNGHNISGEKTKFIVGEGTTLTICDCSAGGAGSLTGATQGSAVAVKGGTFNLYSGKISGNNGTTTSFHKGAGVNVDSGNTQIIGTFNMYGGEISNNSTVGDGGGVHVNTVAGGTPSTFDMYGGKISDNSARRGGGVYAAGSDFTMHGGTISGNYGSSREYESSGIRCGGGGVYVDDGAKFTMKPGSVITGNDSKGIGGGVFTQKSADFIMEGGEISHNSAVRGGGVFSTSTDYPPFGYPPPHHEFKIYGGTISNNTASEDGGGVYNEGIFTMSGGTISNNDATNGGGGVYNKSTFTMEGGTISSNEATGDGGGVYNWSTFNMNGGTISSNKATGNGGGVYVNTYQSTALLTVNNTVQVTGNKKTTDGKDNNVYLSEYESFYSGSNKATITIGNSFDSANSQIGITLQSPKNDCTEFAQVTSNGTDGEQAGFTADDKQYVSAFDSGVVNLTGPHDWNEGEETKSATCMEDGSKDVTCNNCSTTVTLTIDKVDHNWDTEWYKEDATNHWHYCAYDCGTQNDVAAHVEDDGTVTLNPTATTKGEKTYRCEDCKRVLRIEEIPMLGNNSNTSSTPTTSTPGGGGGGGGYNPPPSSTVTPSEPESSEPESSEPESSEPESSEPESSESEPSNDESSSAPSEITPPITDNPETGVAFSVVPLALIVTALGIAITVRRKNMN